MIDFSRISRVFNFRRAGDDLTPAQIEVATRQAADWAAHALPYLPNPDEVLRKLGRADGLTRMDLYRRLLSDDRVGSDVETFKAGVKSLEWQIDDNGATEEVVDFVKECLNSINVTNVIGEILNAPLFGMQPFERLWDTSDGKRVRLKAFVAKPPEWFVFDTDGNPRFLDKNSGNAGIPLSEWPNQFQIVVHDGNYQNPYGFPILSRVYWPVVFKKGGLKFWITFLEKWGMPHAVAYLDDTSDRAKVSEWLKKLQGLVRDSVAVLTRGGKVELLEPKGSTSSGDLYKQLVNWADDAVTTVLLGHQGATSATPGNLGGTDKQAAKTSDDRIWAGKALVKEVLDLLIRDIVTPNFGEGKPAPVFNFTEKDVVDVSRSERDRNLQQGDTGLVFTDQYYQRVYGFQAGDIAPRKRRDPPDDDPAGGAFSRIRSFFAKAVRRPKEEDEEQAALAAMLEALSPETLQGFSEQATAKIVELIGSAQSYEDVREGLKDPGLLEGMDVEQFEAAVTKVVFLAEMFGRMQDAK